MIINSLDLQLIEFYQNCRLIVDIFHSFAPIVAVSESNSRRSSSSNGLRSSLLAWSDSSCLNPLILCDSL